MIAQDKEPTTELQPQFSSEDAAPISWAKAREHLQNAEVYWLSTVRPNGRPHVTSLIAVWLDGALYFCTGETERKAGGLGQSSFVETHRNARENSRPPRPTPRFHPRVGFPPLKEGDEEEGKANHKNRRKKLRPVSTIRTRFATGSISTTSPRSIPTRS